MPMILETAKSYRLIALVDPEDVIGVYLGSSIMPVAGSVRSVANQDWLGGNQHCSHSM